jgi:hypothetical protein
MRSMTITSPGLGRRRSGREVDLEGGVGWLTRCRN